MKENLLSTVTKLGRNPLHTESVLHLTWKVKRIRKRHGTTVSTYRWIHRPTWKPSSPWSGRSMENNQTIPRRIWRWIWLFVECSWTSLFKQQFILEDYIWDSLGELFEEMKRLICELSEILDSWIPEFVGLEIIELEDITWRTTSVLCERASHIISANVYIFSDSVQSMGEMRDVPNAAWMNKIKLCSENNHFKELNRIDDMQTEFEWKIFWGFTTKNILDEIQTEIHEKKTLWTWARHRYNHLHVNVRWNYVGRKRQYRRMSSKFCWIWKICS